MNRLAFALLAAILSGPLIAQQPHAYSAHNPPPPLPPPKADGLVVGYGDLHHPVTTTNPVAQKFFDQGLRYIYAFNHDEANAPLSVPGNSTPNLPWLTGHCGIGGPQLQRSCRS